jgi:hypothetical protein
VSAVPRPGLRARIRLDEGAEATDGDLEAVETEGAERGRSVRVVVPEEGTARDREGIAAIEVGMGPAAVVGARTREGARGKTGGGRPSVTRRRKAIHQRVGLAATGRQEQHSTQGEMTHRCEDHGKHCPR